MNPIDTVSQYQFWPLVPVALLFGLYHVFMPAAPPVSVEDLALHQKLLGGSAFPVFILSLHYFLKVNRIGYDQ